MYVIVNIMIALEWSFLQTITNIVLDFFSGSCAEYFIINEAGSINVAPGKKLDRDTGKIFEARGVCFIVIEVSFVI